MEISQRSNMENAPKDSTVNTTPIKILAANSRGKVVKRQYSMPCQTTHSHGDRSRLVSEGELAQPGNLTGGTKNISGSISYRAPTKDVPHRNRPPPERKLDNKIQPTAGENDALQSHQQHISGLKQKPLFGKGRLERGKQISHLGLFPQTDKQFQRQSTSMTAEAGDHPADLEELVSPNPERKLTGSWRKQVELISEALTNYGNTHPQFSSQLAGCRLGKMVGLKTVKSLQGDQLTISVTFDVNSNTFDFRAPASSRSKPKTSPLPTLDIPEKKPVSTANTNGQLNVDQRADSLEASRVSRSIEKEDEVIQDH